MVKGSIVDGLTATAAISTPMWVAVVHDLLSLVLVAGGVALVAVRLAIAWKNWKNPED